VQVLRGSDEAEAVEAEEEKGLDDFVNEDDRKRADADTKKALAATANKTAAAAARAVVEGADSVRFGPTLNANRVLGGGPSVTRRTVTGLAAHAGGTGVSYIEYTSELSGAERLKAAEAAARGGGGGGGVAAKKAPAASGGGGGGGLFD